MLNTFEKTQRQHERRLARERQLQLMEDAVASSRSFLEEANNSDSDMAASASGNSGGGGGSKRNLMWKREASSSSMDSSKEARSNSLNIQPPPTGAAESARRFLWEENDDNGGLGLGLGAGAGTPSAAFGSATTTSALGSSGRFGTSVQTPMFGGGGGSSHGLYSTGHSSSLLVPVNLETDEAGAGGSGRRGGFGNLFDMGGGADNGNPSMTGGTTGSGLTPHNYFPRLDEPSSGAEPPSTSSGSVLQKLGRTLRNVSAPRFPFATQQDDKTNPLGNAALRKQQLQQEGQSAGDNIAPRRSSSLEDDDRSKDGSASSGLYLGKLDADDNNLGRGGHHEDATMLMTLALNEQEEDMADGRRSFLSRCMGTCTAHSVRCMGTAKEKLTGRDKSSNSGDGSRARRWFLVFVALLGMALGVLLARHVRRLRPHSTPADSSAANDDDDDRRHHVDPKRFQRIRDALLETVLSDPTLVELQDDGTYPRTPQYRALDWMVSQDEMRLDPDDPHLTQRYTLALLWFATTGASQRTTSPPSVEPRAYRHSSPNNADMTTLYSSSSASSSSSSSWVRDDHWMSSKGICMWWGVQCRPQEGSDDVTYDKNNMVTVLNLTRNELQGSLPEEVLQALTDLQVLDLSFNGLAGSLPSRLGAALPLQKLDLTDNFFRGTLPASWVDHLPALTELNLGENDLTGTLPPRWGDLSNLQRVGLWLNHLQGSLPLEWARLGELRDVRLAVNDLTGTLPPNLDQWTQLQHLSLSVNQLHGSIPPEWSSWTQLQELDLHSNQLEGTLSLSWATGWTSLQRLQLFDNTLTGTLPPEFGASFPNLQWVQLERNELSGSLPESWGQWTQLHQLLLWDNQMTGTVPDNVCALDVLQELIVDCAGEEPLVHCDCCTKCV